MHILRSLSQYSRQIRKSVHILQNVSLHQIPKRRHLSFTSQNGLNIVLCSGQGSQYVGMLNGPYAKEKNVQTLVQMGSEITGIDLQKLASVGPKEELDKTVNCQLLILMSTLVAAEILKETQSHVIEKPHIIAGYSVGELAALALANSISYHEAFTLVMARAKAMQYASDLLPSGMVFVQGLDYENVLALCQESESNAAHENGICRIAIESYSKGFVIGGTMECLHWVANKAARQGHTTTQVQVSGAFHTPIMEPAQSSYNQAVFKVSFKPPRFPVASNVTGGFHKVVEDIPRLLVDHLVKPVKWKQIIQTITATSNNFTFYELGPGKQLKPMIGKIDRKLLRNYVNVSV